jgi:hypothetical protein
MMHNLQVMVDCLTHGDSSTRYAAALSLVSALNRRSTLAAPGLRKLINHKLATSAPGFLCVAGDEPAYTATLLRLWTLVASSGSTSGSPRLKSGTVECLKSCLSLRSSVSLPVGAAGPLSAVFGSPSGPHMAQHTATHLSTSIAEKASALIAELAVHDDWLLAIVRCDCLPPLRELLASGSCDAVRTSAAALAALCRHPSTHERMLSSGCVDIILRRAGCKVRFAHHNDFCLFFFVSCHQSGPSRLLCSLSVYAFVQNYR